MQQLIPLQIRNHCFLLSAGRAVFWEAERTLMVSDLHFGKTGHFRKSGIAVPQNLFKEEMQRFVLLLQYFKPVNLIVIGDMFHSHDNREHQLFKKWRQDFGRLPIQLVMGNHDILEEHWYTQAGINTIKGQLQVGSFSFVHDIKEVTMQDDFFYFSGHIHPSVNIGGVSKQSLRFPCFYLTSKYAVLPAFGKFTGTYTVKPKKGDSVFAVLPADVKKGESAGLLKVH
ncbi:MAG TPA: ligase-associated DNA damage response endonuclease PdeM [Ferruginibacter sp.]|nr:ligase-associated DNA damage response endonuclease PdeM [Ferruginibacter sp.]HMP21872.1 ligase-associated DNA damage response endonuclease PdeM [Ferruginibacter sp.]